MRKETAVIIIDTGFSLESIKTAKNVVAIMDLSSGLTIEGSPTLSLKHDQDALTRFAHDPLNHGSLVLKSLTRIDPNIPLVLVRAYTNDVRLIRTGFDSNGQIVDKGWTEAYKWAVELLSERGYNTVTNCSFGGYLHAMDGSGWEAHCLKQFVGAEKPGHIVLAGAGSGDDRAIHASWHTSPLCKSDVTAEQDETTTYNFWAGLGAAKIDSESFVLEVFLNGTKVMHHSSTEIVRNFWNDRRQITFTVFGKGEVRLRLHNIDMAGVANGFHCWINHQNSARFTSHANMDLVSEPAVFQEVIAVGLKNGKYAPDQEEPQAKPDLLIEGSGPISFRLPEVVAKVAKWLSEDHTLDTVSVRTRLLTEYCKIKAIS